AWVATWRGRRREGRRLEVSPGGPRAGARARTSGSRAADRPSSWAVSTSWPSRRSSSTAGRGKSSSAYRSIRAHSTKPSSPASFSRMASSISAGLAAAYSQAASRSAGVRQIGRASCRESGESAEDGGGGTEGGEGDRWRFFFSSRRRHTRFSRDWSSDVCSSDLPPRAAGSLRRRTGASALTPRSLLRRPRSRGWPRRFPPGWRRRTPRRPPGRPGSGRSEERRVGKAARARRTAGAGRREGRGTGGGFFFQAEDGIRDFHVTGVQTCALPIFHRGPREVFVGVQEHPRSLHEAFFAGLVLADGLVDFRRVGGGVLPGGLQVGRGQADRKSVV